MSMPSTFHAARAVALLPALLALLILVGCTPNVAPAPEPPSENPAPPAEATAVPVAESATPTATPLPVPTPITVFTVGVNPEFEPFVFRDGNGNLAGFDIDLLNALSAAGDFEFGYATTSFNGLLQGLNSSAFDAAISAITVTDERRRTVDFTEPYFGSGQAVVSYLSAGQGIAVRNDNTTILGSDQLAEGVRVGVKANTTGERYVVDQTGADFVRFEEAPQALDALVAGEVDAVVVDIPVITYYIRDNPTAGIKLAGGPVTEELYAIAVSKSEPELLAVLNAALQQIAADGTYDQIFTKWFGSP